jgi:chromosome segregation ATPase
MNRLLKAKLVVLQQDFDKMLKFYKGKESSSSGLETKYKTVVEEKMTAVKSLGSVTTQLEKLKKVNQTLKTKNEAIEASLISIRRDADSSTRAQKAQSNDQTAQSLRLNRTLEEIDKLKNQLSKTTSESRDKIENAKRGADGLQGDLQRCEKQKGELMAMVKKQGQLIEVLKRQKIHVEAARLLEFTEAEFIKALSP